MEREGARCREGNQLLANQLTVIEKRLNFLLQKADKNQQPLMAGDATLSMKFTFPQVKKPKIINKNPMSSVLLGYVGPYLFCPMVFESLKPYFSQVSKFYVCMK